MPQIKDNISSKKHHCREFNIGHDIIAIIKECHFINNNKKASFMLILID